MRPFAVLLLAASAALTQTAPGTPPNGVYRVGGGVAAPALIRKQEPQYSEDARRTRYQGTVLLYVEIDPEGKATNIKVQRGLGLGLDERAIEAVQSWQFKPGTKDGNPVTVMATIEINFRLLSHWSIARQEFNTTEGAVKPTLRGFVYPPECAPNSAAQISLSADIDSDGHVTSARVMQSSNPALEQPAIEAVQKWIFTPARWQNAPQPVTAQIELACKP